MVSLLLSPIKRFRGSPGDREFRAQVKRLLGFSPRNIELYKLAVVHKSASMLLPRGKRVNNERLEYLGDAVLDAIVADYLFAHFPNQKEGFLTKMRSKIVSRSSLNQIAVDMGIDKLVVTGNSNPVLQKNIYGNALEALVGAMFLDRGYHFASEKVINNVLERYINIDDLQATDSDYKSRIIEWAQKNRVSIHFSSTIDPSQNGISPHFVSQVLIDDQVIGEGTGSSKKEAEQNAAMIALSKSDELIVHLDARSHDIITDTNNHPEE